MTTIDLYYEIHGPDDGSTPLVLVHGGAGVIDVDWGHAIRVLSPHRRLIAVELQGHGHTPHHRRPYTFDNSAADIAALVESLGVGQVDIMGFSNGGPTVLRFALRRPELTRRVVVASGFTRRDGMIDGFWDSFDDPSPDGVPPLLAEAYGRINPDPDDFRRMFELDVTLMCGFVDWADADLAGLRAPAMFVSGDRDIVRGEHTLAMSRLAPDGRALVVPAAHGDYLGAVVAEELDEALVASTWRLITRFLDGDS
ncbi:alpha/beta fold hydrolase [Gordonia sp. NPDC003950]